MHTVRYISLFSGGFGLDLGMEAAGFEVAICVEIGAAMRETIRYNRPNVKVMGDREDEYGGDLYKLSTNVILERAGLKKGEVDLIVGGPPCQAFSILGNRQGFTDSRGNLMLEFVRVVKEAQPKCFVMENVAGFLTLHKGAAYAQVVSLLEKEDKEEVGYYLHTWKLNAVDYGVPQYRERVFIVGFRKDLPKPDFIQKPEPTHRPLNLEAKTLFDTKEFVDKRPPYRVVRDVLQNLPTNLLNHEVRLHGPVVSKRYSELPAGSRDRIDHTDRLRWDYPSGTVLVGSSEGGGRPFIHPQEPRHLTVREAARLQAFPDDWFFCGKQTDQYRQVGNAVPPLLAQAVGERIALYFIYLEEYNRSSLPAIVAEA